MELSRDLGAIVATAENKIPLTYINCNLYYTVYITWSDCFQGATWVTHTYKLYNIIIAFRSGLVKREAMRAY